MSTQKERDLVERARDARIAHETSKVEYHAGRMSWEEFNRLQLIHREAQKAMRKGIGSGFHRKLEAELKAKYPKEYAAQRTK